MNKITRGEGRRDNLQNNKLKKRENCSEQNLTKCHVKGSSREENMSKKNNT